MSDHHQSRRIRTRLVLAVLSALALVGALFAAPSPATADAPPLPTSMTVTASNGPNLPTDLGGTVPGVLTAVNQEFEITVALWDGSSSAAYPADAGPIQVTLTANDASGQLAATALTIPAGASSATISESYSAVSASLQVTGTIDGVDPLSGRTDPFVVNKTLRTFSGNDPSLRNGTASADGQACVSVTPANPVCALVTLPNGTSGEVAMTSGPCPTGVVCKGAEDDVLTQFIGSLTAANGAPLYDRSNPARMTIICDASLCGDNGVPSYLALWSDSATGDMVRTKACPAKGVIGADQDYCTDSRASNRGRGGDLELVVLFDKDVRGTI